ncbi:MAG: gcvPA [Herbinix sp.]|jgi:glycine dehydrogenase subunit 1|nr:gcvPA [Herbinix sp.]
MGKYFPHTSMDRTEMLQTIGCSSIEELFINIPQEVRLTKELDLPEGLSESQVKRKMEVISKKNKVFDTIFRGAGAYNHYIPSAVKSITSKEEFVTAYTPYQAEISQGILQSIFEYQTMICELTGMEVSNASVYDGATAAAEAVVMCKEKKRTKVLLSGTTNPQVIETIQTYCKWIGVEIITLPDKNGVTDLDALRQAVNNETACVYLQQPNFFGQIEDAETIAKITHEAGAKLIMGCNPISLAVIKTPAEFGADIAVGEGQPLGLPLSFGGPYLGFMATTEKLMRRLPGRIVGETKDVHGNRAFVLTLQAREQHIRRENASSNICSNQALCAMTAAVYLSTMGKDGLYQAAVQSMSKAHYLSEKLSSLAGFELVYTGSFFHEFVTRCPKSVDEVMTALEKEGILGGYSLDGENQGNILWCVTEMNSKEEMDRLVDILREVTRS